VLTLLLMTFLCTIQKIQSTTCTLGYARLSEVGRGKVEEHEPKINANISEYECLELKICNMR
jgi:hypothetical protein